MIRSLPCTVVIAALAMMSAGCESFAGGDGSGSASEEPVEDRAISARTVWVGTYTGGDSRGIYRLEQDVATGALSGGEVTEGVENPSFVALHPGGGHLYVVEETSDVGPEKGGSISAFAIRIDGSLEWLGREPSGGGAPCHLVVDSSGRNVIAANYTGGNVSIHRIGADGSLGERSAFVQHEGTSVNERRQEAAHAHNVRLSPDERFLFVSDLGLDKVMIYRFDAERGTIEPNDPAFVEVAPGSGPRHFAFHPDGRRAYVIGELDSTITTFDYDPEVGSLGVTGVVSTLPDEYGGTSHTAEVVVHPSGRFVYGSNRGHDSIACFRVGEESEAPLSLVEIEPSGGETPRNFNVTPDGRFLVVANQVSGDVVVFSIDRATGAITPTGAKVDVPRAVCVVFSDAVGPAD